jgi:S-(hydroxymethyl)glutathione dehydrogenase / alcohol dehydrogenase
MPTKARAAILYAFHEPFRIEEIELADPKEGEVLVEMHSCGICHSDISMIDGSVPEGGLPIVLGHEGAGVVRALGPGVKSLQIGDHVLPMPMAECGQCESCRSRKSNFCDNGMQSLFGNVAMDGTIRATVGGRPLHQMCGVGAFSTHTVVHEAKVAKIDSGAPMEGACLVSCAVSTGVGAVIYDAKVPPGATVAVFGLGAIGLNIVQGARLAGAKTIIGLDRIADREGPGRALGLTHFVQVGPGVDAVEEIRKISPGGVEFAFDAVGGSAVARQALSSTRIGCGLAVLIGVPDGADLNVSYYDIIMGRRLMGSMLGGVHPLADAPRLVELERAGKLNFDTLITHRLPFERINEGIELLRAGKAIRTVLSF